MLEANPRGRIGAPYLPAQFVDVLGLVLNGPLHRNLQTLKQLGI